MAKNIEPHMLLDTGVAEAIGHVMPGRMEALGAAISPELVLKNLADQMGAISTQPGILRLPLQ